MYIAPNSTVRLCNGIPYDSSYQHTIYFSSPSEQLTYFVSKTKFTLERNYYVRRERGTIKVKLPIGSVIDCNYMLFKNTSYENKWFYAFITDVEFVNNETTRIRFVLDYIQTYLFDIDFSKKQFIERYTQPTDVAGDNLIPENFETGEYVTTGRQFSGLLSDLVYVLAVTVPFQSPTNFNFDVLGGFEYDGIYSGLCYEVFNTADELGFWIMTYNTVGITKRIVGVFMMPADFAQNWRSVQPDPSAPVWENLARTVSTEMTLQTVNLNSVVDTNLLDGDYVPRNKKLLTAPYNLIHVTNGEGQEADFAFEYFDRNSANGKISFGIGCTMTMPPTACCIPRWYKTIGSEYNYKELLMMNHFPQCSYNSDTFKAYLAQIALPALAGAITPMVGLGATAIAGGVANAANDAMGTVGDYHYANYVGSPNLLPPPSVPRLSAPQQPEKWDWQPAESIEQPSGETNTFVPSSKLIAGVVGASVSRLTNPPHSKGQDTRDVMASLGKKDFCFEHLTITKPFARIIDSYFDRFGYAYHKMDTVNLHTRPEWTYIKTCASDFHGNFPQDVATTIDSIFDNGITFWANSIHVGNYDLNNAPV